ncbi:MAG: diguanylate cyclase [Campylobacterales bacterium]|nr:diguanylate cyclase [Campylobacterales bacterium]
MDSFMFKELKKIEDKSELIFANFYTTIDTNSYMKQFFSSQEQLEQTIARQKKLFFEAITKPLKELQFELIEIGKIHYQRFIPFELYISGANYLQTQFLFHAKHDFKLRKDIRLYFETIRNYGAKGYLNTIFEQDLIFLDELKKKQDDRANSYKELKILHIEWLTKLILAIKSANKGKLPELDFTKCELGCWLEHSDVKDVVTSKENYQKIYDMHKRVHIVEQNIFFFVENKKYVDLLNAYSFIFKLSFSLSNMLTFYMVEKREHELITDELTTLYTRRKLKEVLQNGFHCNNNNITIGLLLIDIDNFKQINDTFGHDIGDIVLKEIAESIKNSVRNMDMVFRYGGEEFLVLLPVSKLENIKKIAEKIRKNIEQNKIVINSKTLTVTVSIGTSSCDNIDEQTFNNIIKHADENLYIAKRNGKNQVVH